MPHDASIPGSGIKWTLSGSVANTNINCSFTVPTSYQWSRSSQAIKLTDPCGLAPTLMVRSGGSLSKQFGRPTIRVQGAQATNVVTDLETAWSLAGPWTLVTPTETLSVVVDGTQGDFVKTNLGTHIEVQTGFQEV